MVLHLVAYPDNLNIEQNNLDVRFISFGVHICRFLQGPETDPANVRKIREAIDSQRDVTVQLINYSKSGM